MFATLALVLSFALFAVTGLFWVAPDQAMHGIPWATDACQAAPSFCDHPERIALTGIVLALASMSLRGIGV